MATPLSEHNPRALYYDGALLVDTRDSDVGLLSEYSVEMLQKGFEGFTGFPLWILMADPSASSPVARWTRGEYFKGYARLRWSAFCRTLRQFSPDGQSCPLDRDCDNCARENAPLAEQNGRALAYMCCHGLIELAAPVTVAGRPVAVLLTGQLLPTENEIWPAGFLRIGALQGDSDAVLSTPSSESQARIRRLLARYDIPAKVVTRALREDPDATRLVTAGPAEVGAMLQELDRAASLFSELATQTYQSRRFRLFGLVRWRAEDAMGELAEDLANVGDLLRQLGDTLGLCCPLMHLDFAVVLGTVGRDAGSVKTRVLVHAGLPQSTAQSGPYDLATTVEPPALKRGAHRIADHFFQVKCGAVGDPGLRAALLQACDRSDPGTLIYMTTSPATPGFCALFGGRDDPMRSLAGTDLRSTAALMVTLCHVAQTFSLLASVKDSQNQEAMDRFIEDVAHDIRTPIQAIITKVSLLKRLSFEPKQYLVQAGKLGAAVMRIDLTARRIWTAQMLQRGALVYKRGAGPVPIEEAVRGAVQALADLAESEGVEVEVVAQGLKEAGTLYVDSERFYDVLLNLIHNAIKYSAEPAGSRKAKVIVNGCSRAGRAVVSVGDRGIGIQEDQKELIFQRYYRSPAARRFRPEGMGIGLSIVMDFVQHYKGKIVITSDPIEGTGDFHTVFSLHLPKGD